MNRMKFGNLDLSVIDPHERDTKYIYDEVFVDQIYYHPEMRMPRHPVVMDVGANIGLYAVWAHHRYQPRAIYCYEASPQTYAFLADNTSRLVDHAITKVHAVNRAVASKGGETLVLHQSPLVSGIGTLLGADRVGWVRELADMQELIRHEVTTTTLSAEIDAHGIERVDLLKVDVEGFLLEVLGGISDADFGRIGNIVAELDYVAETGADAKTVGSLLTGKGFTVAVDDATLYAWRT